MARRGGRRRGPAAAEPAAAEPAEGRPLRPGGPRLLEEHPDGQWVVQSITGSTSTKAYRCPGCDQPIPPATPHLVTWPADLPTGVEHRRHWHRACWNHRLRRR